MSGWYKSLEATLDLSGPKHHCPMGDVNNKHTTVFGVSNSKI
jgi:hypothetical protein